MSIDERISRVVDHALEAGKITGTVVLVYQNGEPLVRLAAGFADREAGIPVGFGTIFRLASVTKPIVAATALAMVERGLLSLSEPVSTYLPWFRPPLADGTRPDITLHQLLTHTAGLSYDPAHEKRPAATAINCGLSDTDLDFEGNFSRHNAVPLAGPPGGQWIYSIAIDILGAAISAVHGGTLEEAVVTYIAGPLGMQDTRFHVTDPARLAVAYADAEPVAIRMPDPYSPPEDAGWTVNFAPGRIFNPRAFQSGGAGMAGTAVDVMTFLEALQSGGKDILSNATVRAGFSNQIGAINAEPGTKFGYFGALVDNPVAANTSQPVGTVRWGGVYGNNWFIDPVNKLTVLSFSNNALEGCMGQFPDRIVRAVYGA